MRLRRAAQATILQRCSGSIYGYLNQLQSSRRLEREAGRNLEVMWLTGKLAPDFKTVADFRREHGGGGRQPLSSGECTRPQLHAATIRRRLEQADASIVRYL
jgi:transposase